MVSFRSSAPRSAASSPTPCRTGPSRRGESAAAAAEGAADRAIRRDFDALAARIRILQARIQQEAAGLHAR